MVDGLPSDATKGGLVSGVADLAFAGNDLYALLAAGGCSHGNPDVPNGLIHVHPDGAWDLIADLSEFLSNHPVQNPDPSDPEPDGTWYSLLFIDGAFYALDPHNGEVDQIDLDGEIRRVVDISASQGHIVPTTICVHKGDFYVGNLSKFPLVQGAAKVLKITRDGKVSIFKTGFTNIFGVLLDEQGCLFVLEGSVGVPFPAPDKGRLLRIDSNGKEEVVTANLSEPSAMTFAPDGALYISNKGYGYAPGMGEIIRVEVID